MFQVHTSEDVLAETVYHWRKQNPRLEGGAVTARLRNLRATLDEIVSDFPGDAPFCGADQDDYHVHAAALASRADVLLTNNKPRDFSSGQTHYEIITSDQFFCDVARAAADYELHAVIHQQMKYWSKTSRPESRQLDDALLAAGCPQFAGVVQAGMKKIALSER